MKYCKKNLKSFSIMEILVSIGIFAITTTSISILTFNSVKFIKNDEQDINAANYTAEVINAIVTNKNDVWMNIIEHTGNGLKDIEFNLNEYSIIDSTSGSYDRDGIDINFEIERVYRDSFGDIVESIDPSAIEDETSRLINIYASWTDIVGISHSIITPLYLNAWDILGWSESSQSDFAGTTSNTEATTTNGGAIELTYTFTSTGGDWCDPLTWYTDYNSSIQGNPNNISLLDHSVLISSDRTNNTTDITMEHVSITNDFPPVISTIDTYSIRRKTIIDATLGVNWIYYIVPDNREEFHLVDLTTSPYSDESDQDIGNNSDPVKLKINETDQIAYILKNGELISINYSNTASITELDQEPLENTEVDFKISNNYAYVVTTDNANELEIIDISNPSSLTQISLLGLPGNDNPTAIFVNDDETRAYITKDNEIYVVDISIKNIPLLIPTSSITSISTNINDVAFIDDHLIIVGEAGEEYSVYEVDTLTNLLTYCGGMGENSGIIDLEVGTDSGGNYWAYMLVDDSSKELKLVQGGNGGSSSIVYSSTGTYTSEIFDTTNDEPAYYSLAWSETLPPNTDIEIQVRTSPDGLFVTPYDEWLGPDGTNITFFSNPTGEDLPDEIQGNRYIQYRIYMSSDGSTTPIFEDIIISYQ